MNGVPTPPLLGAAGCVRGQGRRGVAVRASRDGHRCHGEFDEEIASRILGSHRHRTSAASPEQKFLRGIVPHMLADQWCKTSWRASAGSFVSLMTLYESNFLRLGWLVRDLQGVRSGAVSRVSSDCDLYLSPLELSRYTSLFRLTYEFSAAARRSEILIWRSACITMRDWRKFAVSVDFSVIRSSRGCSRDLLDDFAGANMLLNKWLEYCVERGHRF